MLEQLDILDIEKLRSLAKARGVKKRDRDSPQITKIPRDGGLPLSFAQQRLWFLAQLEPESTIYNIPFGLRMRGDLDASALRRSLDALFARHESLRSIFVAVDGQPHVELLPAEQGLSLVEEDLRGLGDRWERAKQLSREEAGRAFDLSRGPLVRARLIRLEEQEYVFLLTQHHIVSDEWSKGILVREIGELYRAFSRGRPNPLPPLGIQYPDYAGWQRKWLSGERLQKQTDYWRQTLADTPVLLDLPTDHPRPLRQSFEGASITISIDSKLTQGLRELSSRSSTTLFMTLLGAWAAVLSRLSGQQDLVIGVPITNRGRPGTEGLIGFFLNTLALRVGLRNEPSVAELLGRVRATVLAAQEHQDLPFEQVVGIVQPPRHMNHTPLFQIMLLWENDEQAFSELPRVDVESVLISHGTVKFDLELALHEQGDTIVGSLNYATALFDEGTLQRQRGYLLTMLQAIVANSEQKLADIELLSEEERRLQLETWNATAAEYPQDRCIHELFEEQVRKSPEARAVVHEDRVLSYSELNAQANRLAHYLIGLGVGPDDRVAICVERSAAMVIGLLAILKAGGAYVPLDPAYPSERLSQIVGDAAPSLLLIDAAGRAALGGAASSGWTLVDLEPLRQGEGSATAWSSQPAENAQVPGLTSRHLAYVIYTSGSTGTPKGVMNEHRALINRLLWMQQAYGLDSTDVVLQKTTFSFDVSVWEFFWTLQQGATLLVPAPELHKDPAGLIELMVRAGVTTAHFVPSMLDIFLMTRGVERCTALRRLICSGEALPAAYVQACREKLPGAQLHNLYGPTEAAVDVTAWTCPPSFAGGVVPIGRPIANTRIYLLDEQGQPALLGATGELYIGGDGIARGYFNRPELTAERFLKDPFSPHPEARMYRTGDLARYLPDGNIEYLGRNDFQVKIRGFRIELGEIEARLSQHALVREAVVEARDAGEEKRLAAYVIPAEETIETDELVAALRAYLATTLPDYMVPSAFVRMAAWPLTPNGKLDRKALPAPDDEAYVRHSYEPPQSEVEAVVAQLWSELLDVERIGRHDNFFELGGHSLLAVQLMERLRRVGLGVEIRTLFATPVLADLAVTLGSYREAAAPPNTITAEDTALTPDRLPLIDLTQSDIDRILSKVPGGLANLQDIYALAPLQEGILFHHLLAVGGDPYLLTGQMAFLSRTVLDQYLAALQQVIDRHDILRTAFVWEGLSIPAQVVWRQAPLSISELTLDPRKGPIREQLAKQFDPRTHRMDLTQAPLLRFFIAYDAENNRWLLLQSMHHLVGDHSTLDFLREEVQAILAGQGHRLAAPQPFRRVVAQGRLGISQQDHEHFFRSQLADIDEPTLPFGLSDVHRDGGQIIEAQRKLPQALNDRLRSQARRLGVSLASLCHLAWGQVLARSSGQERVVFGTVLFGRMQAGEGADRAMGLFINTLPLRLDLEETGVEASVRHTHARLADLLRHEHASLALAQRCSGVRAPAPLFSALLNYRHNSPPPARREDAPGPADDPLQGVALLGVEERTNYPITLSVEDFGQALGLTAQVVSSISPERVCGYMQQALESLAHALETAPQTPVRHMEILPPEERRLLLETWNATKKDYPDHLCIHQLFEEQVEKRPEATAVVYEEQSLSYGELNEQANRLAHYLIRLGVKPDDRVAICVERGAGMVIGLLGILKAGGAYVPLDPSYPVERLRYMLQDSAPSVLLIQTHLRGLFPEIQEELRVLDLEEGSEWKECAGTNPDLKALGLVSQHLAYVIYTSGSTGMPKGVMVEHAQVTRLFRITESSYGFNHEDVWCLFHSIAFDFSVWEVWGALGYGGRLVIVSRDVARSSGSFYRLVCDEGVTVLNQTPSAFKRFIQAEAEAEEKIEHGLRYVIFGGEALEPSILKPWYSRHAEGNPQLVNMYGITETTVHVTYRPLHLRDTMESGSPVGKRLSDLRIYLLDNGGKPVPLGATGELYIGGDGVARGYFNRPELTAERFLKDPFSPHPEARMYRTGDLARYLADGNIEYLGRNDFQVKIRGFRIELGEIEARLSQHALVREAVVEARDAGEEKRLAAYVIPAEETIETDELVAALRAYLATTLPDYMIPSAFVRMVAWPLTPNGKLDRKALPAPDDEAYVRREYEAPQGEIEQTLAGLWRELLQIERIGRQDDFFELGGHSLLAVRLLLHIRQSFGAELPVAALFAQPTLAGLAQAVIEAGAGRAKEAVLPMARISRDEPMPLSFAQQRLWFLAQLEGVSATYHIPLALRLRGALDRAALGRALDAVLARHEGLRSVFVAVDGEPQVRLLPETTGLPLIEHDLRGHENASVELARLSKEEARASFDLAQGPLIRGRLVQLADDDHVLLLTQHHIVSDGWSIGVLSRELTTLYQAFQQGQANPLPPLTIQYPDCAAWQRAWLSGERLERQIAYWREALTGAPALLELPTDRPRPAQPDYSGARVPVVLDAELTRSLKQLSQRHGTTLFMTVLAAWAAVLSRLSGQDEVVIGTLTANRGRAETEGLIGLFVSTLALRIQLDESPSVSELLSRARRVAVGAQDHQDLPFEQVVEIVQPPRRLDHTPIFQVLFNWQNNEISLPNFTGVQVSPPVTAYTAYEVVRFDLELSLSELNEQIVGSLAYATALFDATTIERHVGYLQVALRAMVSNSEQRVAAIELLSEEERRLQLETWNATAAEYPQDRCIHELFEEQVRKSPEARAVVHEDRVLSYSELNAQANRLAHYLIGLGVGPDDRVAICVERSAAMVIGLLAILKAGGAYVPLDPAYPSERLSQIVGDAAPSLLLIDAAGRAALGGAASSGWTLVDLEPLRQGEGSATAWSSQPAENAQVPGLTSRHLAYVIYTSGSTGTPKGVMVEHQQVANFLSAMASTLAIEHSDGWLAVTSIAFDIAGLELYLPLARGARIVLAGYQDTMDPSRLQRLMSSHAIRIMQATPATWNALLGASWPGDRELMALCGGEAMPRHFRARFQGRCKSLWNLYGPTETTIYSSFVEVALEASNTRTVPIGRPIANTRIYLLDEQGQPALLGATGELYIGGDGVARGYFNRPELTAERFLKDPFSPHPEARMYRTGDLARYLADGNIEYLGRNDFQVKIRGFRIELGEIEARLSQHALVREAVVEARDAGEEKRLAAYVIPAEETIETDELVAALRAYLATTLPDYMIPSAFVRMVAWPLTPNGKLDRKALPAPDDEAYARREYEAPQGEIEQTLAGLWRELLQIERIGRQDDFFELGGHSLTATRLLARIRQALGVELPVATVFARPTLMTLAQAVAEASATAQAVLPMARISREEPMPLSFAQQRLWFLAQLEGVSATYHIPLALRLRGALDRAALGRALDTVLARHEGLRSVFVAVDGEPLVRLLPETTGLPLIEHDLRGHENASVELARLSKEEARAPFDLAQGPLIRSRLVQLADDDHVLLLTQHHIVSDGWSIGVLSRELTTLYQAFQQGQANPLPPLTIQYPDYAAWQRGWLSGERLERQTAYWREALTGAPALLELPTDRPRPAQPDYSGARVPIVLDAELTRSLKQLSQRHGTTLFMTVLAAWAVVLSRLSGQDDVVIGTPTANRGRVETEGLIGFFISTLALRIQLDESPSVSELLSRVRKFALAAQEHQDLPFEQVVEIVQPPRRLTHTPIFQVALNWQNNEVSLPELTDLHVSLAATPYSVVTFDLELYLSEVNEQIVGSLAYATALFDAATMERQMGYLQSALRAMVSGSEQPVAAIELLSDAERRLQLERWNATAAPYPQDRCIHELFEEQVRNSPEARAVVHEDRVLSYSELNAQANRLAHYLIGLGVGPDDRVAICVERSAAMVIGLLAILKAGGAYVPLDPAYPSERLSQIVGDAAPSLLLIDAAGRAALGGAASSGWTLVDLEPLHKGEGSATAWSSQPAENAQVPGLTSRHLAYVIYTSGSTGTPKGVMVEHGNLISYTLGAIALFKLSHLDTVLQQNTLSFDLSVEEIFPALISGAVLAIHSRVFGAHSENLSSLQPTFIHLTAAHWQALVSEWSCSPNLAQKQLRGVRLINVTGDAISSQKLQIWETVRPEHVSLVNTYGPTEATVSCTAAYLQHQPGTATGRSAIATIGRPMANASIYLLGNNGQPVPLGAIGELYVGGAGVARGYLNRPDLSAERFLFDPFSSKSEARMYRTGDLARYLPDGNLEFLGRNDQQVKIRGFRVEPREIEARLTQYPGVREAVVIPREDTPGDKRLVAYMVLASDSPGEVMMSLRKDLSARLPDYMIPAAFVQLDTLPLTPNGKLDRKALPAPDGDVCVHRTYEAPQGKIEQALAALWRELLRIERVSRRDHFFELGGHSLLAMNLIMKVRKTFACEVALRDLFSGPTLAEFAALIDARQPDETRNLVNIRPKGSALPLFFVHAGGGAVDYARQVAPFINTTIPIYGLTATGLAVGEKPLSTVPQMAERYVKCVREIQPHGPYRLTGWSDGGTIAYEMANILLQAGETVQFLGLIDTFHVSDDHSPMREAFDDKFELLQLLSSRTEPAQFERIKTLAERLSFLQLVDQIYALDLVPKELGSLPAFDGDTVHAMLITRHTIAKAVRTHLQTKLAIPVWLFEAQENGLSSSPRWRDLLGDQLHTIAVPGDHMQLMMNEANRRVLGAAISDILIQATELQEHVAV